MMGRQTTPERLFYDFCLEDHVPADHLLRQIDGVLALNELRDWLKPFYSAIGRPSVDPELMVRMLLVATASASGPNGGSARRCTSIWPTAGSAASAWKAKCRTIQPSRSTAMAGSVRRKPSDWYSRAWCAAAWQLTWSAAKVSQSMPR